MPSPQIRRARDSAAVELKSLFPILRSFDINAAGQPELQWRTDLLNRAIESLEGPHEDRFVSGELWIWANAVLAEPHHEHFAALLRKAADLLVPQP